MPPRSRIVSKPKNFKGTGIRLIKDFKKNLPIISCIIVLAILSAVLSIFSPILINRLLSQETLAEMFDGSTGIIQIQRPVFFSNFGIILGVYLISALFSWLSEFLAVNVSANYAKEMRQKVQRKLDSLPLSYYDRVPYGDTLSVAVNDVDNIARNLQTIITQVFASITLFIGAIIAMFVIRWELAFVAICSLPFTILIVIFVGKISGKKFELFRKQLGELNGKIEENYAGFKVIKLFNKEEDIVVDFNKTNEEMRKSDGISQFLSGFIFPSTNFINNLAYVAIAVTAGLLSDVAGMITFFLLLNCFTRPFQQLGQIFSTVQSVVASGERIYSLLDEPEVRKDKEEAIASEDEIKGNFSFNNVYFQYTYDKPLIEKFFLDVKAGDTVAIVGPTGAGKTTMVNLIMRFYDITNVVDNDNLTEKTLGFINAANDLLKLPKVSKESIPTFNLDDLNLAIKEASKYIYEYIEIARTRCESKLLQDENTNQKLCKLVNLIPNQINLGNIYLDGRPLDDYKVDTLRGSIGMVLQDTWLFKGTIKENLLFGDQNATDEEIIEACKKAHIHHFIETLPGGYNFELNEDGTNISQGQRQLLTIARAIISKPKILILDEATSSVDTRTEQAIQDALNNIMINKTSFVIAHRLSTIKNSKMIIVMKKGHIVEVGNHKELLQKGGFYADLYNSQFSGVNPMEKQEEIVFDS